jgi:hypothetical protein
LAGRTASQGPDSIQRSPEILNMEDSLRRMLKLDLGPVPQPPASYQSS